MKSEPNSYVGKSRLPSPERCWRSTPSTSRTCNALLAEFKSTGSLGSAAPTLTLANGVELTASAAGKAALGANTIATFLKLSALVDEFEQLRLLVRDRERVATTVGVGPRYIHSTGQLHKGRANKGELVIVAGDADIPIPGQLYSFATLARAQALGDFASLDAARRRAVRVHFPAARRASVRSLADELIAALSA